MRKLLTAATLAIFSILAVNAQCNNNCQAQQCGKSCPGPECRMEAPHGRTVESRVDKMKECLSLTDEQCSKLTKVITDFDEENQALREKHRKEMQERRDELDNNIEKILTPEQQKIFKEKREQAPKPPYTQRPRHKRPKGECPKDFDKPGCCNPQPACCQEQKSQCCQEQ